MTNSTQPSVYFKVLRIIHASLLFGQLSFGGVAYLITEKEDPSSTYIIAISIITCIAFALSILISKIHLKKIKEISDFKLRMTKYLDFFLIRLIPLEIAGLFSIVAFLITGQVLFFAFTGVLTLCFLLLFPSKQRVADDLNLNFNERHMLQNL